MQDKAVLITRPEPGASDTARRVRDGGWAPVVAPLLRIRPLPAPLPDAERCQAVLVASLHALGLPASFHARPLLTVGDATAGRARAAGFREIRSAGRDAAALAALARATLDPAGPPLLLSAGRGQGAALADDLRAAGFRVIRRATYHAAPVSRLPDAATSAIAAGLAAALFFSAETSRTFVRLLPASRHPALTGTEALAISAAAAAVLSPLPWRRIRVAVQPTQNHVLALL